MAVDEDATREGAAGRSGPPHTGVPENGAGPEALVERVQELTTRLAAIADPGARASAEELVSAVIELYGEGLERIFAALDAIRRRGG